MEGPRDHRALDRLVRRHICPGSYVIHDGWGGYVNIKWAGYDMEHTSVNHSKELRNIQGLTTNHIEGTWSVLKRWLRKHFDGRLPTCEASVQHGLVEFVWRRLQTSQGSDPLKALLKCVSKSYAKDGAPIC